MTTIESQLIKALEYLAGVCDGAQSQDACGFNRFDTVFGKDLATRASMSGVLTSREQVAAAKMLQKYHGQLEQAGLTLPKVGDVIVDGNRAVISSNNGRLVVKFQSKPDEATRSWMKRIAGWRYHPENFSWSFPVEEMQALQQCLPDADFWQNALAQPLKVEPKPKPLPQAVVIDIGEDGALRVMFPDANGRAERVKALKELAQFEARWMKDEPGCPWKLPITKLALVAGRFAEAQVSDKAKVLLAEQKALLEMSSKAETDFTVSGLGGTPYPFQLAGVEFVDAAKGRALIADEMGLGKTIQALAYLQLHPELRPALIICPASLKLNWQREARKWLTIKEHIQILNGGAPYNPADVGVTIGIINYDILTKWQTELADWGLQVVIMDEAHYIKSPKAQRSVAAARIAKDTAKVILLTGTPVINRPIELFNLLKTLDPAQWSNFWAFVNRYCGAKQTRFGWDFSGATNLDELHQITRTCVIRRTKQQVLTELPEKQQATVVVEFDKSQRSAYQAVLHETEVAIEEREPGAYLAQIEKLKQAAVLGKLPAAMDWIADFIEAEKLVVFCTHTMVVDALMQRFGNQAVKLTGSDSQKQRQAAVDSFQNDDSVRLFVGNIKAAGVGITLTAASNVAFLEFGWTPGEHSQAADRVHRIGQRNAVTVWWLITEETIEGDIVSLLESKRQVVDKVTDGEVGDFDLSIMDKLVRKIKSGSSRDENTNTV